MNNLIEKLEKPTEDQEVLAERHVQRIKVTQRLKDLSGDFVPDWKNKLQAKYYPSFDHKIGEVCISVTFSFRTWPYAHFRGRPDVMHAINTLGDDLKVLFEDE